MSEGMYESHLLSLLFSLVLICLSFCSSYCCYMFFLDIVYIYWQTVIKSMNKAHHLSGLIGVLSVPCCQICNWRMPSRFLSKDSFIFFGYVPFSGNRYVEILETWMFVSVHVCPVMKNMLIISYFGTDWSLCIHATILQFLKPNRTSCLLIVVVIASSILEYSIYFHKPWISPFL